jgi:hypothetical protein
MIKVGPLQSSEINKPIRSLRYGFRFQLSDDLVSAEQEDVWWNELKSAGATQQMTTSDIPVNVPEWIGDQLTWNHPEFLRRVSVGHGYLYLMVYIVYADRYGSHDAEYCGAFHWQPQDTASCHHHYTE